MSKRTNRRRMKRYINHLASKLKHGQYFEDCRYHPCVVTQRIIRKDDICGSDLTGISLVDKSGCACSMFHCGPWPISREVAEKQANYLKVIGHSYADEEYVKLSPVTEEQVYLNKLYDRIRWHVSNQRKDADDE